MGLEAQISQWFLEYAYDPIAVYGLIVAIMFASSCGLPLPEEVILISAGLAGYMSLHPETYPPPYPGAQGIDPITLAVVCFVAVFVSDFFIYWLGSYFGDKLMRHKRWGKKFKSKAFLRVQRWIRQYGNLAPCIFRFTPGLRFPGHLMCGAIGLSKWKFIATDGTAALLTVPTQILLISYYGEVILDFLSKAKYFLIGGLIIFVGATMLSQYRNRKPATQP